jgi:hypothetical protein
MNRALPLLEFIQFFTEICNGKAVAVPIAFSLLLLSFPPDLIGLIGPSITNKYDLINILFLIRGLEQDLNGDIITPISFALQSLEEGTDVARSSLEVRTFNNLFPWACIISVCDHFDLNSDIGLTFV